MREMASSEKHPSLRKSHLFPTMESKVKAGHCSVPCLGCLLKSRAQVRPLETILSHWEYAKIKGATMVFTIIWPLVVTV